MEIDVAAGYRTVQDVDDMIAAIQAELARLPDGLRVVIVADWSACQLFTPEISDRAVQMLLRSNVRTQRSAIYHQPTQPTSVLQVFRLIKEADAPFRRVFTDLRQLYAWLDQVLEPAEQERLRQFFEAR